MHAKLFSMMEQNPMSEGFSVFTPNLKDGIDASVIANIGINLFF